VQPREGRRAPGLGAPTSAPRAERKLALRASALEVACLVPKRAAIVALAPTGVVAMILLDDASARRDEPPTDCLRVPAPGRSTAKDPASSLYEMSHEPRHVALYRPGSGRLGSRFDSGWGISLRAPG